MGLIETKKAITEPEGLCICSVWFITLGVLLFSKGKSRLKSKRNGWRKTGVKIYYERKT